MSLTLFANATSATGQQLDNNFAFIAAMAANPCTATGTNAITITVTANGLAPTGYQNYSPFVFTAANNTTGAVTLRVGTLPFLNVYLPSGTQAGSGTFSSGDLVVVIYNSALNTGSGGFEIIAAPAIGSPSLLLDQIGNTQGDILYRDAAAWKVLAPGSNLQVLTSQGPAANPKWANIATTTAGGYNAVITTSASIAIGSIAPTATPTTQFKITAIGGGAGGGGVNATAGAKAGGGASGQWVSGVFSGINGLTLSLTIGGGGAGGANTGANGTNGSATSVAFTSGGNTLAINTQTSSAGTGSTNSTVGQVSPGGGNGNSAGTLSATGTITLVSTLVTFGQENGQHGIDGANGCSGGGGSTPWGSGGAGATGAGANNGNGYGAGGGGASSTGSAAVGGNGSGGAVLIEWVL